MRELLYAVLAAVMILSFNTLIYGIIKKYRVNTFSLTKTAMKFHKRSVKK